MADMNQQQSTTDSTGGGGGGGVNPNVGGGFNLGSGGDLDPNILGILANGGLNLGQAGLGHGTQPGVLHSQGGLRGGQGYVGGQGYGDGHHGYGGGRGQGYGGGQDYGDVSSGRLHPAVVALVSRLQNDLKSAHATIQTLVAPPDNAYDIYVNTLVSLQRSQAAGETRMVEYLNQQKSMFEFRGWITTEGMIRASAQAQDILRKPYDGMRCFEPENAKLAMSMSSNGPNGYSAEVVTLLDTAMFGANAQKQSQAWVKVDQVEKGISDAMDRAKGFIATHDAKIAKEQVGIDACNAVIDSMDDLSIVVGLANFLKSEDTVLPRSLWSQLPLWFHVYGSRNPVSTWQPEYFATFLDITLDDVETFDAATCLMLLTFLSSINYTSGYFILQKLTQYKKAGLLHDKFNLKIVYENSSFSVELGRLLLIIYLDLVPMNWNNGGFRIIRSLARNANYCPWMYPDFAAPLGERLADLNTIVWPVATRTCKATVVAAFTEAVRAAVRTLQQPKRAKIAEMAASDWKDFVQAFPMKERRSYEFDALKNRMIDDSGSEKWETIEGDIGEIQSVYAYYLMDHYAKSI